MVAHNWLLNNNDDNKIETIQYLSLLPSTRGNIQAELRGRIQGMLLDTPEEWWDYADFHSKI